MSTSETPSPPNTPRNTLTRSNISEGIYELDGTFRPEGMHMPEAISNRRERDWFSGEALLLPNTGNGVTLTVGRSVDNADFDPSYEVLEHDIFSAIHLKEEGQSNRYPIEPHPETLAFMREAALGLDEIYRPAVESGDINPDTPIISNSDLLFGRQQFDFGYNPKNKRATVYVPKEASKGILVFEPGNPDNQSPVRPGEAYEIQPGEVIQVPGYYGEYLFRYLASEDGGNPMVVKRTVHYRDGEANRYISDILTGKVEI